MKIYKLDILSTKDLQNLTIMSELVPCYDTVLVIANTNGFEIRDLKYFLRHEEMERLTQYKTEISKINFAVSRGILNKALEVILGIPFEDIVILQSEYHKPYIKSNDEIQFNISHTTGCVVVGFSKENIGVDIEKVNHNFEFECILRECFTYREMKNIRMDVSMFYKYWTAKEAYLKYEGCGLIKNPKAIEVAYMDDQIIKIEDKVKKIKKDFIPFSLLSGEYVGAICI